MELRNITESIVVDFVDGLDDIKTGLIDKNQKLELIAYVLNRLRSMYVTSNKGFMYILVKFQNDPQYYADIMVQINEGINLIKKNAIPASGDSETDLRLLRNITEYIVVDMVNQIGDLDETQKFNLFAFVLNRLKPLYITSDRKFPEILANIKNDAEYIRDIEGKIHDGMMTVKKITGLVEKQERLDLNAPYFSFPKYYGKLISSTTFMYMETGKITLFLDNKPVESDFSDMKNPVELEQRDRGIYMFAPKPIRAERENESKIFVFTLLIENNGNEYRKIITHESVSELGADISANIDENIMPLDDIYVPFK